ncbi:phosphatidylinositol 5-phosphate 4-kinase [Anaeramoeba flamelloides]|uniref:Phosphatidylinositol 5-phosphate 4-kinase n=1 Tax=Anaeramoeba flamelloides TaxID=1746091 RepID=A0ABQ8XI58_9EUKA|nr:phosphatidylinositol 5-phosphate 4-kinase [Anaeramoeba flamelloides]
MSKISDQQFLEKIQELSLDSTPLDTTKTKESEQKNKELETLKSQTFDSILEQIQSINNTILSTEFTKSLGEPEISYKINKLIDDLPSIGKIFDHVPQEKLDLNEQINQLKKNNESKKSIDDFKQIASMYHQNKNRILSELKYIHDAVDEGIEDWSKIGKNENEKHDNKQIKKNNKFQKNKTKQSNKNMNNKMIQNQDLTKLSTENQFSKFVSENKMTDLSKILLAFQQGVQISNQSLKGKLLRKQTFDDEFFQQISKIELDSLGNQIKENDNTNQIKEQPAYIFQEFGPLVYHHLRVHFNISARQYVTSLCSKQKGLEIMVQDGGRSGANFFISKDKNFVLKFIEKSESNLLNQILKEYYRYIITNPNTLLTLFYGHYSITTPTDTFYFIIMNNVFSTDFKMDQVYDLKGSKINRGGNRKKKKLKILKDNDLNDKLILPKNLRNKLISQITSDSTFLKKFSIMDYSLLLGIHHLNEQEIEKLEKKANNKNKTNSTLFLFQRVSTFKRYNGGIKSVQLADKSSSSSEEKNIKIYFLGMIDCLQVYNVKKKVEHGFKTIKHLTKTEMSAVDPELYAKRFINLVKKITISPKK